MSYVNRQIDDFAPEPTAVVNKSDYHDLVRWGPILSGLVVALATQLILSALGGAIGTGFLQTQVHPDQTQVKALA